MCQWMVVDWGEGTHHVPLIYRCRFFLSSVINGCKAITSAIPSDVDFCGWDGA